MTTRDASVVRRTFAIACDIPQVHARIPYLEQMRAALVSKSGGRLDCAFNPDGRIYPGVHSIESVAADQSDLALVNAGNLEAIDPRFGILSLPFMLTDVAMAETETRQRVLDALDSIASQRGWRIMSLMRATDALFVFPDDPGHLIGGLLGRRIRVGSAGVSEVVLRALGADPVALPVPMLRQAFLSGRLDGAMTSPGGWLSQLGMDAPCALMVPGLMLVVYALIARSGTLADLSPDEIVSLRGAADDAILSRWNRMAEDDAQILETMQSQGATLRVVTDIGPWREAMRPVAETYILTHQETWEQFRSIPGIGDTLRSENRDDIHG